MRPRTTVIKIEQHLRQSGRKTEKPPILYERVGSSQASAQYSEQPDADFRIVFQERDEVSPVDHHEFAGFERRGIGAPRLSLQHRHLAQDLALAQKREHHFLSFR